MLVERVREKNENFQNVLNEVLEKNNLMRSLCRKHGLSTSSGSKRYSKMSSILLNKSGKPSSNSTKSKESTQYSKVSKLKKLKFFDVIKKGFMFESPFELPKKNETSTKKIQKSKEIRQSKRPSFSPQPSPANQREEFKKRLTKINLKDSMSLENSHKKRKNKQKVDATKKTGKKNNLESKKKTDYMCLTFSQESIHKNFDIENSQNRF